MRAEVVLSVEYSVPGRKARIRGSPNETPPCTLMAPGACKFRHRCNVLQIPIKNNTSLGVPKPARNPLRGES